MEEDIIKDFKFTEEYIQKKLDGFFAINTPKYVLENLYVFDWESDKFIETKSGLIYEFEIKISRSDFKHDFDKKDKHAILEGKECILPSYQEKCEKWNVPLPAENYQVKDRKRPNYFYYAVPEGLVDESEVPEYAGLVYVLPEGQYEDKDGKYCMGGFYVVKNAPKLHSEKYADDDLKLGEKFYYNMLSWKERCQEEKQRRLMTEEHKIPYAEMKERMEKAEKECRAQKTLVDSYRDMTEYLSLTMEDDMRIMNAYRRKMKEFIPDFDCIEFEDKFLKED